MKPLRSLLVAVVTLSAAAAASAAPFNGAVASADPLKMSLIAQNATAKFSGTWNAKTSFKNNDLYAAASSPKALVQGEKVALVYDATSTGNVLTSVKIGVALPVYHGTVGTYDPVKGVLTATNATAKMQFSTATVKVYIDDVARTAASTAALKAGVSVKVEYRAGTPNVATVVLVPTAPPTKLQTNQ